MSKGIYKRKPFSEEWKRKNREMLLELNLAKKGKTWEELYGREKAKEMKERLRNREISEETKKKMSEASKGENNPFYGKHHTQETKIKLSKMFKGKKTGNNYMKGKHHSEETKKKMSETRKGRYVGKNNNFYGRQHSQKTKNKISKLFKDKTFKERYGEEKANEIIEKMKNSMLGKNIGTYEEKYGIERAKQVKEKISNLKIGIQALEKNPMWKGGISFEPYGLDFNTKIKRKIRERDGRCMLCNVSSDDLKLLKRMVHIHHIDYIKTNNFPQNLITLCHNCHNSTNVNRIHWTTFFQSLLSEQYNYKYSQDQKIILDFIGDKQ